MYSQSQINYTSIAVVIEHSHWILLPPGLSSQIIYIYIYIIQGGSPRGRSIQYECSILTAIDA